MPHYPISMASAMTKADSIASALDTLWQTPALALCKAARPLCGLLVMRLPVCQVLLRDAAHQRVLCSHMRNTPISAPKHQQLSGSSTPVGAKISDRAGKWPSETAGACKTASTAIHCVAQQPRWNCDDRCMRLHRPLVSTSREAYNTRQQNMRLVWQSQRAYVGWDQSAASRLTKEPCSQSARGSTGPSECRGKSGRCC